ncbi:hypothetical protein [Pseudoneobacillus sp. C159]
MSDWNEQAAPNNNLTAATIQTSKLVRKKGQTTTEFSTDLTKSHFEGRQNGR